MVPPLFDEPPTLVDEAVGARVWLIEAHTTFVGQLTSSELTPALATWLSETAEAEVKRRWASVGRQVSYLHDWRSLTSYDAGARLKLIEWGRVARGHTRHISVCLSSEASAFVRIAAATGMTILKAVGVPIQQVDSVDELVAALKR